MPSINARAQMCAVVQFYILFLVKSSFLFIVMCVYIVQ